MGARTPGRGVGTSGQQRGLGAQTPGFYPSLGGMLLISLPQVLGHPCPQVTTLQ